MAISIANRKNSLAKSVVAKIIFAGLTAFVIQAHAESVTLSCSNNGTLIGVSSSGAKTTFPSDGALRDRVPALLREAELKRNKLVGEICAQAESCINQFGPSTSTTQNGDVKNLIGNLAHILATVLENDERQKMLDIAENGAPDEKRATIHTHLKTFLEKKRQIASSGEPAQMAKAYEEIQRLVRMCTRDDEMPVRGGRGEKPGSEPMKLNYSLKGINRNKAGTYDKTEIKKVIEQALLAGVDPYAAVAIVLLENAPVYSKFSDGNGYKERYGTIPVDAIGAYDLLGCASSATRRVATAITTEELASYKKVLQVKQRALDTFRKAQDAVEKKLSTMSPERRDLFSQIYIVASAVENGGEDPLEQGEAERVRRTLEQRTQVERELAEARSELANAVRTLSESTSSEADANDQKTTPGSNENRDEGIKPQSGSGLGGFGGFGGVGSGMMSGSSPGGLGSGIFGGSEQVLTASQQVAFQKHRVEYLTSQLQMLNREVEYFEGDEKAREMRRNQTAAATAKIRRDPEFSKIVDLLVAEMKAEKERREIWISITNGSDGEKGRELECLADSKGCYGRLQKQSKIPVVDLRALSTVTSPAETTTMFCSTSTRIRVGGSPEMFEVDANREVDPQQCCASVKSSLDSQERRTQFLGYLGIEFIKQKIQNCFTSSSPELCLQRFNGMGCFGCTEKMGNNCYDGLVGADRPIYGARAADLMINTLMTDDDFGKLVSEATNRIGRPVRSAFCSGKPAGQIKISSTAYLEMQKKFLMEGASGTFKTRIGNAIKAPENAAERAEYSQREAARAKTCAVHFKP